MTRLQNCLGSFLIFTTLCFTISVDAKSIYLEILGEKSFPIVKIKENYSKVNSRSPSNLVTKSKPIETSSQSAEESTVVTLTPEKGEFENVSDFDNDSQLETSPYQEKLSKFETSSSKTASEEQPEDLMKLKIESIMRRKEEMAHLLETMAINHLNARYGGYVVQ